jgi:hypothetical protein
MAAPKKKPATRARKTAVELSADLIRSRILLVRGKRVLLDADIARFYGVDTRSLNQAVVRNEARFPEDFAFKLTRAEMAELASAPAGADDGGEALISQSVTSKRRGGTRKPATVFTEQGVAMLASVLRSPRAVAMSIAIVRAFVQLREMLTHNHQLAGKLAELERKLESHDDSIHDLFEAMRQLLASADPAHDRKIGFHQGNR